MNYDALLASHAGKVVRVGLVGVGDFGATLLAQSRAMANMEITVACDRDCRAWRKPSLAPVSARTTFS